VGGTFTDAVLAKDDTIWTAKSPTTPDDQSRGVLAAVDLVLAEAGCAPGDVDVFAHGMTVATNALLEGRGARTVFVATDGFTDVVELGRQARADLYRLRKSNPKPLATADLRVSVDERMGPDGVVTPLDPAEAEAVADRVAGLEPEAVAVCLLHADRYPAHERMLGEALRNRLGAGVHVSLSHEVVGTFREFERAATTEVDAALSPLLAGYLERLGSAAGAAGLPEPAIMQSNGGLTSLDHARSHAALTVLSGPAGGAAAAALVSAATGRPDLLCFDMGGTSCDVCVVENGRVRESAGRSVGGRPIALPMVDIHTVGAGGGSIAWLDAGGALRVGPRSAGAVPGPACYGLGGTDATVTDANVVLGHIDASRPLTGGFRIDADLAREAVAGLAAKMGGAGIEETAAGILRVANMEMVQALRVMTVERGVDPRRFALLAFGGAGPLHAAAIADELEIETILVPHGGGVLSALGLAVADRRRDSAVSVLQPLDAFDRVGLERLAGDATEVAWDLRYRGQSFELTVRDVEPDPVRLAEGFGRQHRQRYGFADPDGVVELVTVRRTDRVPGPGFAGGDIGFADVDGPASVDLGSSTVWVPDGWRGRNDGFGNLVLERR